MEKLRLNYNINGFPRPELLSTLFPHNFECLGLHCRPGRVQFPLTRPLGLFSFHCLKTKLFCDGIPRRPGNRERERDTHTHRSIEKTTEKRIHEFITRINQRPWEQEKNIRYFHSLGVKRSPRGKIMGERKTERWAKETRGQIETAREKEHTHLVPPTKCEYFYWSNRVPVGDEDVHFSNGHREKNSLIHTFLFIYFCLPRLFL